MSVLSNKYSVKANQNWQKSNYYILHKNTMLLLRFLKNCIKWKGINVIIFSYPKSYVIIYINRKVAQNA